MKIVYLSYSAIPSRMANSVHVMKMCASLAKLGHQVVLFAPDRKQDCELGVTDPFAFYGVDRIFELVKLPWPNIRFRFIWYLWEIWNQVPKIKPDLVYSRYLFGNAVIALKGMDSIFETHSPVWMESRFQEFILRILCKVKRIKTVVVISEALVNAYIQRGIRPSRGYILARDAADSHSVKGASVLLSHDIQRLRVGYVGQLYQGKGMEVIAAIASLVPDVDFHIIGGYDADVHHWREIIKEKNVFFHGFVQPALVGDYLASIDVCLLPNQSVIRTFSSRNSLMNISEFTSPLKMFEYMSEGKAIVCSRLPVLQEVLDESMSLFADPERPEEWVMALNAFKNPALRAKLGENAKKAYLAYHTWDARALNLINSIYADKTELVHESALIEQKKLF